MVAPRSKTLQTLKADPSPPPTSSGASELGGEEPCNRGDPPGPCIVFTAGAKEVLTAWLHAWEPETGPSARGPVSEGLAGESLREEETLREGSDGQGPVRTSGEGDVQQGAADGSRKVGPSESRGNGDGKVSGAGERWVHSWRWLGTHDESREAVENRVRTVNASDARAFEASESRVPVRGGPSGNETELPSSKPSSPSENVPPSADASHASKTDVPLSDGLPAPATERASSDGFCATESGRPSLDAFCGSSKTNPKPDQDGSANPPPTPETTNPKVGQRKKWAEKDDQRYLAVTAFSTGGFADGSMTCFVVTASADSRLVLRAFHPASRTWHLLARLEHHKCPVLSLDYVTHPLSASASTPFQSGTEDPQAESRVSNASEKALSPSLYPPTPGPQSREAGNAETLQSRDPAEGTRLDQAFLVVSGATDGSLAFWDVSEPVHSFRATWQERVAAVSDRGGNSRPPTGRGSAGGGGVRRLTGPRMSKRRKTKMAKAAASALGGRTDESVDSLELSLGEDETGGVFDTTGGADAADGLAEELVCQEGAERKGTAGLDEGSGELPGSTGGAEGGPDGGGEAGQRPTGNGESARQSASHLEATVSKSIREARDAAKRPAFPGGPRNGAEPVFDEGGADDAGVRNEALIHTVASLAPMLVIEGAHQSGVNGLSVAAVAADVSDAPADVRGHRRYVAVSGGDDQAIHTVDFWVGMNAHGAIDLRLGGTRSLPLAHSSAVKGGCAPPLVLQRFRVQCRLSGRLQLGARCYDAAGRCGGC